jgi:hypothetical protein
MKQTWAYPNPANGAYSCNGNLYTDVIFVDPSVARTVSAPARGQPASLNGCGAQGWVKQIGNNGEWKP